MVLSLVLPVHIDFDKFEAEQNNQKYDEVSVPYQLK